MWKVFLNECLILVVKFDGAPMKLDAGNSQVVKKEVIVRCLKGVANVDSNGGFILPFIMSPRRFYNCYSI